MDARLRHERLLLLEDVDAKRHLSRLSEMLAYIPTLAELEIPWIGGAFNGFVLRLRRTVEAILLKHEVAAADANADIKLSVSINGVDSGYPVFSRDLEHLARDQQRAAAELRELPKPEELVDVALEYLFRETWPERQIRQMTRFRYFHTIAQLELPRSGARSRNALHAGDRAERRLYLKTVERMDERNNLPRFYVIYLGTTARHLPQARWEEQVDQAVQQSLGQYLVDSELPHFASAIEEVDGLTVEALERIDVGPFHSPLTSNEGFVRELLDGASPDDGILMLRRHRVHRAGQRRRPGLRTLLRALTSRDTQRGHFTAAVASPLYTLLPHRLIQKAHHDRIQVPEHVALKAITHRGVLLD